MSFEWFPQTSLGLRTIYVLRFFDLACFIVGRTEGPNGIHSCSMRNEILTAGLPLSSRCSKIICDRQNCEARTSCDANEMVETGQRQSHWGREEVLWSWMTANVLMFFGASSWTPVHLWIWRNISSTRNWTVVWKRNYQSHCRSPGAPVQMWHPQI